MQKQIVLILLISVSKISLAQQNNFSRVFNVLNHNEYAAFIYPFSDEGYLILGGGIEQLAPDYTTKNYIQYFDSAKEHIFYLDSITSEFAGNYAVRNDTFYYLGQFEDEEFPKKICLFKSDVQAEPLFLNTLNPQ